MVEVTVHDILLRVPKGVAIQWPQDYSKLGNMAYVLLKERVGERILSIWVGLPEGLAMAQPLAAISPPRPMTHDLIVRLVEVSESQVTKVMITKLHEQTFYATLWVRVGDHEHEVDARPSDALSLALRVHAPIFVAADLFEQQSLPPEQALPAIETRIEKIDPPGEMEMEWQSFRFLLCNDADNPR